MRTLPTKEQINYLVSTGIEEKRLPIPAAFLSQQKRSRRKAIMTTAALVIPPPKAQKTSDGLWRLALEEIQSWFDSLF